MHLTCTWQAPDMHLTCTWHAPDKHPTSTWHAPDMHLTCNWHAPDMQYLLIRPSLKLKTQPKQLYGSLPQDMLLQWPLHAFYHAALITHNTDGASGFCHLDKSRGSPLRPLIYFELDFEPLVGSLPLSRTEWQSNWKFERDQFLILRPLTSNLSAFPSVSGNALTGRSLTWEPGACTIKLFTDFCNNLDCLFLASLSSQA